MAISAAACIGHTDLFFLPDGKHESPDALIERERQARALCHVCPEEQQVECLAVALLERHTNGIWAGRTPLELRQLWHLIPQNQGAA